MCDFSKLSDLIRSQMEWSPVKQELERLKMPINLLKEVLFLFGTEWTQSYGYSIMKAVYKGKSTKEVAEYVYNTLCDQDLYKVASYFGGGQDVPEVENNIDGKPATDSVIFVFGNDENGAVELAKAFQHIQHQYSYGWDVLIEVTCLALVDWDMLEPGDKFFQKFIVCLSKELTVDEVC